MLKGYPSNKQQCYFAFSLVGTYTNNKTKYQMMLEYIMYNVHCTRNRNVKKIHI